MTKIKNYAFAFCAVLLFVAELSAQQLIRTRPIEIDDVLTNPGKGFMTFQRFNGDNLNSGNGWTEGLTIDYQEFDGDLTNEGYPDTTIAYYRVYWKYIETADGKYNWELLDRALYTAKSRGQTLMIRIAPYGNDSKQDVPNWYRKMVDPNHEWKSPVPKWAVNPEDPRYAQYFGRMVRALGARYDGHPNVEGIDLAIVGAWGEGEGSQLLSKNTMQLLVEAYTESFTKTPLIALLMDEKTNKYASSLADIGWRVDCIGDLDFWAAEENGFAHMYDLYPQRIHNCGVREAWKSAPLSFEICGTFLRWKENQGYDREDVAYILNESLKWHISSFNAKSSPVPEEWKDLVDDWLKKMGYRFVLRTIAYPEYTVPGEMVPYNSWWENKGVAPIYKDFLLAIRLTNEKRTEVFITDADIKSWLPGDIIYDDAIAIPWDMPNGTYQMQVGIVDPQSHEPKVNLAIEGRDNEGWYSFGEIKVKKSKYGGRK
ncbi:DUF4832 domain-containing protein [Maribacter sp. ANRC-HE7]|uniref:DUF4832 domain-containing protein n=1 Tax=Maribacter aquimaris TaxID=2737171 RepID=A0ABR7V0Y2_9FLAO|nr:DUF4832 domain-containing protein [Maribacter aquimaris]MBD0777575.1 DUF4832 domain-containing protein [Maribacter aquimaris]